MSYSADLKSAILTNARQSAEILRGGNPAEMPYVLGTRFELVINLKTAKALNLQMPATLLARAELGDRIGRSLPLMAPNGPADRPGRCPFLRGTRKSR